MKAEFPVADPAHLLFLSAEEVSSLQKRNCYSPRPESESVEHSPLHISGYITAGFPSPAEEELIDTISLDEMLIQNRNSSYMVQVRGDSMIGAGIMPGDLVIADRARKARDGDVVIACVDNESWTMKYLRRHNGQVWLEAANPRYPPIHPTTNMFVHSVVCSVIRKYD